VLINNIPHKEWTGSGHWTEPLSGTAGIALHDADQVDDFGDPIAPAQFDQALKPVVTATAETLDAFPKERIREVEPADAHRPSVFLADVSDTLRPFRKRLIKEMAGQARMLDAIPPPLAREAHDQAMAQVLVEADLSIHLLDHRPRGRPWAP